jgi:integrase
VVASLAHKDGQRTRYTFTGIEGLQLDCAPLGSTELGSRTWRCRYRVGAVRRIDTLGSFNVGKPDFLTLAQARERAAELLRTAKVEKRDPKAVGLTLDKLFADYLEKHAKIKKKSWQDDEQRYARNISPRLGTIRVGDLSKADVIGALNDIAKSSGSQANRTQGLLSSILGWAAAEDIITVNPCIGVRKRAPDVARDRVLTDDELRTLWRALGDTPADRAVKLLLLTGQRRAEVAGATGAELRGNEWHLPAARTKNALPHIVPLSPLALSVFADGFGLYPTTVSHRVRDVCRANGIADFTTHDIRHVVITGMASIGVLPHVRQAVANQVSGYRSTIGARYDQHEYLAEKRAALEAWETRLLTIVG